MGNLLAYIILGGLMGLLGQGARAVIGLKSMSDDAKALDLSPNDLFEAGRLITSCLIGFLVGIAAALITLKGGDVNNVTIPNWLTLMAWVAAGYAGTDFLEGFISQYLPTGASGKALQNAATAQVLKAPARQPKQSYPPATAEAYVVAAFKTKGITGIKDGDTLASLNCSSPGDLQALWTFVNQQIPKQADYLPIGATWYWKQVSDVVAWVEYAPGPPPSKPSSATS